MAVQRLPVPGSDEGTWGDVLNGYLSQAHDANGNLKAGSVGSAQLQDSSIPAAKLDSAAQTSLTKATNSVQTVNSKTPNGSGAVTLTASDVGAPTTLATLTDVNATGASDTQVLSYNSGTGKWSAATVSSSTISDASTTSKGIVQLAGDLGGGNNPAAPTLASTTNVNGIISANTTVAGAAQKSANLSDLVSASTARTNLGLGTAATQASSAFDAAGAATTAQTNAVASSLQRSSNLSDLASASSARTNLGLGGAATLNVGTTTGTVAAGNDSRIISALQPGTGTTAKIWITSTDPGSSAAEGDVWING